MLWANACSGERDGEIILSGFGLCFCRCRHGRAKGAGLTGRRRGSCPWCSAAGCRSALHLGLRASALHLAESHLAFTLLRTHSPSHWSATDVGGSVIILIASAPCLTDHTFSTLTESVAAQCVQEATLFCLGSHRMS